MVAAVLAAACGTSSATSGATPTQATCSKAFKQVGGIPSGDTGSIANEQKLQFILDECPSKAALNAALGPFIPAGQDHQAATAQADTTFSDVCQQISGSVKSPLCASLG